jgi:hypothetical protein
MTEAKAWSSRLEVAATVLLTLATVATAWSAYQARVWTGEQSQALAPSHWRPVFLDYLHLGFTNATAFSPTDVMPLTHRAKYTMLVQSTVALALFGLIVARAVNAFA